MKLLGLLRNIQYIQHCRSCTTPIGRSALSSSSWSTTTSIKQLNQLSSLSSSSSSSNTYIRYYTSATTIVNSSSSSSNNNNVTSTTNNKSSISTSSPSQQQQPDQSQSQSQPQQQQQQTTKQQGGACWCILNCKLQSKRIHVSQIKPVPYLDGEKGYVLGEYNTNYETPLSVSRKAVLQEMIKEKEQSEQEEREQEDDEEKQHEEEKKQTKQLFKSDEEREEECRKYPVLNDTTTSIGPLHVLYKNQWIMTVVERTETENKDNEPYFVLKLKTPIRQASDVSFNIESLSYFSSIEKLLSFSKSVECSDKEFEKLFLTKSDSTTKKETKWLVEARPFLREALMSLSIQLLPSIGFANCSINLQLKKESLIKCKQDSSLEFPPNVYQLELEIDSTESMWKKDPAAIEKILYLYTVMFDSIVSLGHTDDAPIDQTYL
ncbi:hypothetical protein SAMD00019534_044890 [Acytostelium subglobosum LB1]|uniref:hypothetical protein n=1 Tax=Acytostelium subglobosum LB1 TaxID=1410327 RepID=UPI000644957B|nr:hypothetical protein SAMD00019534_044890 [Acytostelium subglobosum LB1]GAM21314.1 hypothetical protein SAMD00019534_044890 [Acytostelium subglobosum LB1]|eukprot:XP_012755433.1 hypothetical protein SAMD00019534_044890 [Acytostelium subglobosum LB1]